MARVSGTRLTGTWMPKGFDGKKPVYVQCSDDTFAALKLANMPPPSDHGPVIGGRQYIQFPQRRPGVDSQRYRVVWPELSNGPGSKNKTSSFTLSGIHSNETLFVLAEFLRVQGVEFVALANRHGNAFKSAELSGTELAYLPGNRTHAVLRDCNLFVKPSPIDSGTPRF